MAVLLVEGDGGAGGGVKAGVVGSDAALKGKISQRIKTIFFGKMVNGLDFLN